MNDSEIWWRIYRATFDTNIFFRALTRKENLPNHLISLWLEKRFVLVLPHAIVDEVQVVMSRREVIRKYPYVRREVTDLIDLLTRRSILVQVPFSLKLCRDPKDDMFVDCAASGRVQFLVSYDNDLLEDPKLRRALFEFGVEIVDPPAFLVKIQEAEISISNPNINPD